MLFNQSFTYISIKEWHPSFDPLSLHWTLHSFSWIFTSLRKTVFFASFYRRCSMHRAGFIHLWGPIRIYKSNLWCCWFWMRWWLLISLYSGLRYSNLAKGLLWDEFFWMVKLKFRMAGTNRTKTQCICWFDENNPHWSLCFSLWEFHKSWWRAHMILRLQWKVGSAH